MRDYESARLRLDLRLDRREGGRDGSGYPAVTILVDGEEIFAKVGDQGYVGWHAAFILDPDVAPLLPARPARRVGLYGQDSHWGPHEGCIAAMILDLGDTVAWADIRDFLGVYQRPVTARHPDPGAGSLLGIPDLVFDAGQYRAEVARVTDDPSWETAGTKTVRLLRRYLSQKRDYLAGLGWELEFAQQRREGYRVVFQDADDGQIVLDVAAGQGTPEEQARAMADFLMTTPPAHWPVTHCSRCDRASDSLPGEDDDRAGGPSRHPAHGQSTRGTR
jgi:hypothetical protein